MSDGASPYEVVRGFLTRAAGSPPVNIVICFDGTGGEPSWAVQNEAERGHVPRFVNEGGLSNICKIHLAAGGTVDNSKNCVDHQMSLYFKGVGTWTEPGWKQMIRAAFGDGMMEEIYMKAYARLQESYHEGDRVYIFGFSRGAATARLFASFLDKDENKIRGVKPHVAFLGVFDTVVQSSKVGESEDICNLDVEPDKAKRTSDLPGCVARAVHLVSLDDRREPFKPTLFNDDERVTEVWCPGNHSDVGGGYYHDGLSDVCLKAMLNEAKLAGMKTREITKDTPKEDIVGKVPVKNFAEFDKDMKIEPDALSPDVHDETVFFPYAFPVNAMKLFSHRRVRRTKDNQDYHGAPILVLDSAYERYEKFEGDVPYSFRYSPYVKAGGMHLGAGKTVYRPRNLCGVQHRIVKSGENGFEEVKDKVIGLKYKCCLIERD